MAKQDVDFEKKLSAFNKAEEYFAKQDYEAALSLYHKLKEAGPFSALSFFRIAWISNILGDAEYSSACYYKAFAIDPGLNSKILPKEHPLHSQVYRCMDDRRVKNCPLCGNKGTPYWSYYIAMQPNCPKYFNPIRTWLYCEPCHHLFSAEPTDYKGDEAPLLHTSMETRAEPMRFHLYSRILSSLRGYAQGDALLEVGVGEGECIAVARELLYDVTGIDITKPCVDYVNNTFKLNVIHGDFLTHSFEQIFDIIILGDVLEHVQEPQAFIEKVSGLSHSGSVLWISTPNFESTFTLFAGHNDPMRREPAHCGYFSYISLNNLLDKYGFDVVNYEISAQYNGSMEITAIKK